MRKVLVRLTAALLLTASLGLQAAGDTILRPDHPERYIVKVGDSLWDIASMFLTDAWMWPDIWHVNPEIENPHLIYPGDIIFLIYVDGQPRLGLERGDGSRTVKMSPGQGMAGGDRQRRLTPAVRSTPLSTSIPAIPLDAVSNLLTTGRIVSKEEFERAPHVLSGREERILFGAGDEFFARGEWKNPATTVYGIFREGEIYRDPETREVIGYEALEVGTASLRRRHDSTLYRFDLSSAREDVRVGDRLMATEQRRLESTFFPAPPDDQINGVIMSVLGGVTQVGRNDAVALNRGEIHGLAVNHVLAVYKRGVEVRDRMAKDTVELPPERAGLVLVFRTFEKMAYGLVIHTDQVLKVGDPVRNP